MFGMDMMMKSLGLDPDEIKKSVEGFGAVVVDIKAQLDRIEKKLDALASDKIDDADVVEVETPKLIMGE